MKEFLKYGQGIGVSYDFSDSILEIEADYTFEHSMKELNDFDDKMFSVPNDNIGDLHRSKAVVKVLEVNMDSKIVTTLKSGSLFQHLVIVVPENIHAVVVDEFESVSDNVVSRYVEIIAHSGSHLTWVKKHKYNDSTVFSRTVSKVGRDATVDMVELIYSGKFVQQRNVNYLEGKGSRGTIRGFFIGSKDNVYDINTDSVHIGDHSSSEILVKGVMHDSSKTVYRGMVKINENAKNCDGYQKQDTLILSSKSRLSAVPTLEIANNEVTCSHGVSSGQLDSEQLFYVMSRGVDRKTAEEMIIKGFLFPVLKELSSELQEELL